MLNLVIEDPAFNHACSMRMVNQPVLRCHHHRQDDYQQQEGEA